ncbi:MAG TPA: phosphoglycerate dehydrogenase [Gemmatimonadaceae bacterium]|nr:phosphoglycerate dehydrogenase [Gemmatimonadaceae bacterium]
MPRIVVPDDFPPAISGTAAERALRALGDVIVHTERGADNEAELIRRIRDADVVLNIRGYTRFSAAVVAACDRLRLISIWGTGTDNVDFTATRARGITVTNTPGVNAHAVAEHTIALMLAVARRIPSMDAGVRAGEWPRGLLVQLEGKTLGVIGLGAIGSRVATLASAFGMTVLASTLGEDGGRSRSVGARHVPLEVLLRESDFVSLHLRLSDKTTRHLDRDRLALMKPSAFLINTARAGLVDREALFEALRESRIAGAGLDVFHEEPIRPNDPLLGLTNVVLTPHNAGSTAEVIDRGLQQAVENISAFLSAAPSS